MKPAWLISAGAIVLAACSPPAQKAEAPNAAAPVAAAAPAFTAPAGTYNLDPNHASLIFRVHHMGLSNYTLHFTKLSGTMTIDPANPAASTVTMTVDPVSIRSDFPSDYKKSHPTTGFNSWDEQLAKDPKFLNAGQFPQITFKSTKVEPTGADTAKVTGDLTLLGQTKPVTFTATMTGSTAKHPMTGAAAFGIDTAGTFKRSDFGSAFMVGPISDAVSIEFTGEFLQPPVGPPPAPPAEAPAAN